MQELFRKYLDDQCSPGEVKELLAHFNDPENELVLRELITESLASSDEADDVSQWQAATDKIFVQVKDQLKSKEGRVMKLQKPIQRVMKYVRVEIKLFSPLPMDRRLILQPL
jgi:transmembrane sensor